MRKSNIQKQGAKTMHKSNVQGNAQKQCTKVMHKSNRPEYCLIIVYLVLSKS